MGAQFGRDLRTLGSGRCADKGLRHAVEELADADGARLGDGGHAFGSIGFGIGLRLRTDEGEAAHSPGSAPPELQSHIAADGTTNKECCGQGKVIEKRERVGGKLLHGEHRGIGNKRECSDGKLTSKLRCAVAAKVGNNGANACHLLDERTPIIVIERRGMKENYRDSCAGVSKSQLCALRKEAIVHTLGGYTPVAGGLAAGR